MKKYILLLCSIICLLLNNVNPVFAKEYVKNFYAYEIKNVNIREFGIIARKAVLDYDGPDKGVPLKDVANAYIYTGKDYTYFIKIYPANQDTHIFVVASEKCDLQNNDIADFLRENKFQFAKLTDKNALKEYKYDFYNLARKEKLGNFYVSPDMIKPLKVSVEKINKYLSRNKKSNSVIPYSIDSAPIELACVDTTGYYDASSNIGIVKKEYRLKEKPNKFLHAYEYIVTNKSNDTATVNVTAGEPIGLVEVTSETMVNWDKMDIIDMTCAFPPVIICTAGLSLIGSVPNWCRWARITKEATRYSHALPQNYQLRPQGYMRILTLKHKYNPKPLNFAVTFPNQTYSIKF